MSDILLPTHIGALVWLEAALFSAPRVTRSGY